jgi:hypothetical protein
LADEERRGLGIRAVPQPLACDRERLAALLSFLPGNKLAAGKVAPAHVDAAINFALGINRPSPPLAGTRLSEPASRYKAISTWWPARPPPGIARSRPGR